MQDNFPASLQEVLRHEGDYTNHSKDAGGPTNRGVTQATYDGFRRRGNQQPRSVRYLTDDETARIYKQLYWDKVCGDELPKGLDFCTFDAAVNSGIGRAPKWLQQALNKIAVTPRLIVDGNIGPATLDASDDYYIPAVIENMIDLRLGFMKVAKNTKTGAWLWPIFGGGWANRLLGDLVPGTSKRLPNGVLQVATEMARSAPPTASEQMAKPPLPPAAMVRITPAQTLGTKALVAGGLAAALATFLGVSQWLQP